VKLLSLCDVGKQAKGRIRDAARNRHHKFLCHQDREGGEDLSDNDSGRTPGQAHQRATHAATQGPSGPRADDDARRVCDVPLMPEIERRPFKRPFGNFAKEPFAELLEPEPPALLAEGIFCMAAQALTSELPSEG